MENEKLENAKKALAHVMHELKPTVPVEKWLEHIEKYKDDPQAFFGDNTDGCNQYTAFLSQYDKGKHDLLQKIKKGA